MVGAFAVTAKEYFLGYTSKCLLIFYYKKWIRLINSVDPPRTLIKSVDPPLFLFFFQPKQKNLVAERRSRWIPRGHSRPAAAR